jgi:hypothetical protein
MFRVPAEFPTSVPMTHLRLPLRLNLLLGGFLSRPDGVSLFVKPHPEAQAHCGKNFLDFV